MESSLKELELIKAKEFLTIQDVSVLTNLSVSTIHRRVKMTKQLKPLQAGAKSRKMFKYSDVIEWMNNGAR